MNKFNIKEAVHAEPFLPFTIYLADGRSVHVPAADFVSISPRALVVIVWTKQDAQRIIDVHSIAEIEFDRKARR
jgi:hypothetical protein